MMNLNFLSKIKKEEKFELVEPSKELCEAYLLKSLNNLKAAKVLHNEDLYEDSVSKSYYAMYNSLIALLFRTGIKSENHTCSIMILSYLFEKKDMSDLIFEAKRERIDKEYYVSMDTTPEITKPIANQMIEDAQDFILSIKNIITNLNTGKIEEVREKFEQIK